MQIIREFSKAFYMVVVKTSRMCIYGIVFEEPLDEA